MTQECCKLAGNFLITDRCIISVSVNSSTEATKADTAGDELIIGATIGTVSITAYAASEIHIGCPGRAGVNIPWVKRYDCDLNEVHFIFAGAGQSFVAGDVGTLASIKTSLERSYDIVNASSSSGPSTVYMKDTQEDGYGLIYTGDPFAFTSDDSGVEFERIIAGVGPSTWYLQSFNLTCNPGDIPTVSYSFVFQITD